MTDLDTGTPFVNGTEADASAVNAQFTAIETFLNTTGVHVYQAGTIVNAGISASAEIAVSKLADGAAYDVLQTNSDGTTVAWVSGLTTNHYADASVTAAKCAADVATQAELDAHVNDSSAAHAASAISASSTTLVGVGTDVQAVLEELDNGIADHLADTSAAHAASAISVSSATLVGTGTDVQAVFEELDDSIANHLADTSDAHDASAISVDSTSLAGTATDVQGSLEELDDAIAAVVSGGVAAGTITSAMIADGEIVNADISTTAEIAVSKLADGAANDVLVTDAAGTGVEWVSGLMNAHVDAAAEIAVSKLADGAAYDVLQTNSDGTTVAWVSGLTANHLASDAVTTIKILDDAVTSAKIADENILPAHMSSNALAQYRVVHSGQARGNVASTSDFVIAGGSSAPVLKSAAGSNAALFYFDPTDYDLAPHEAALFLEIWAITETDPTNSQLQASIRRATAVSGGAITADEGIDGVGGSLTALINPDLANTIYSGDTGSPEVVGTALGMYFVEFAHNNNPGQAMTYGYNVLVHARS